MVSTGITNIYKRAEHRANLLKLAQLNKLNNDNNEVYTANNMVAVAA